MRLSSLVNQARSEEGMTLMETLIAVTILGIVVAPLAGAIILGLRTTGSITARVAESHDAQLVTIHLPNDVQSSDTASTSGSACSGSPNVLDLEWTERTGSIFLDTAVTSTYVASYQVAQSGGEWQLVRHFCKNGSAVETLVVARNLRDPSVTPPDAVTVTLENGAVTMNIRESSTLTNPPGYSYTVYGKKRTG